MGKFLIKSISGIRGVIGNKPGEYLTPIDIVECTAGFAQYIINQGGQRKVVVGRDGRMSGAMVSSLAIQTLIGMGYEVIDLGLSTTPTVEMAVPMEGASAGIIFTASHNPREWNALKFIDHNGEFISAEAGQAIIDIIATKAITFAGVDALGSVRNDDTYIDKHIDHILALDYVDVASVKSKKYHIVVDCINSTGAISIPPLLDRLGCTYTLVNGAITGDFAHNPEPLPQHLTELSAAVLAEDAHMGISVDPDVDRLCFVMDNGEMFGEEYTLVAVADYLLARTPGVAVSNLSSTRALSDIAQRHGSTYQASAVGEVNVVNTMKASGAVIGGEGNGGVIVPELHYGRDALAGIAIVLSHLAATGKSMSALKASYPAYDIIKDKIQFDNPEMADRLLAAVAAAFKDENINTVDGVKIDWPEGWVHVRKSNTEPIIRVYSESDAPATTRLLIDRVKAVISPLL